MSWSKANLLGYACVLFTAATLSTPLRAAEATTSFNVSITILDACSITSATDMSFPSSGDQLATNVDATSSISVQCTLTTPYNIGLDAGDGTGATTSDRRMTSGGNTVSYALYRDSARSLNWGDNIAGGDTVSDTGNGLTQTKTVYGRVPSQSGVTPGTYTDTIEVTVTY